MPPRKQGLLCACLVLAAALVWILIRFPEDGARSRVSEKSPVVAERAAVFPPPVSEPVPGRPADLQDEVSRAAADKLQGGEATHLVARKEAQPEVSVLLPDDFLKRILSADESTVSIPLPDGGTAKGRVSSIRRDENGLLLVQGEVTQPEAGRFMFQRQILPGKAGSLVGFIHYDKSDIAYQVRPIGENGKPMLVKTTVDEVICRAFAAIEGPQEIPPTHPIDYPIPPDENGVIQLQSLPGATAVVYLDFDGEERDFTVWGYVNALPSGATNAQIHEVWKGVCEDYQPFNINITTVRAVYDAAPTGRRMQIIITPTDTAAPGYGGVAYVDSFNWDSPMVCWSFYGTGKNAVEVISHEVGHTLGLTHDGRTLPVEAYYAGHNGWAPIMGVGYYQALTQWSKGEYPNADNPQDDLLIIEDENNDVDYRADDHGDTFASATWLDIGAAGVVSNEGFIGTASDEDAFRFSTSGGVVTLNIQNVSFNPNLDLKAEILDSIGTVIATHNPSNSLDASFSGLNLTAGDYFLRVSGVGKGDLTTGYSDYASLGAYTVAGTVDGGVQADRFTVDENPVNGAAVGTVLSRADHGAGVLSFAITSGNTGGAFTIDPATGIITVADHTLLDFEQLSTQWDDPASFELFIGITDSLGAAVESIRTVVTVSDVNELPVFTPPAAMTIAENLVAGTLVTTVSGTDPDRFDYLTYSIVAGNEGNAFVIDPATGVISAAGGLDFETTPSYALTLRATDHLSPAHTVDVPLTINLLNTAEGLTPGTIIRTFFNGIYGSSMASLTNSANFPDRPHSEAVLTSFDSGTAKGNNYGSTVRGHVIAPATGDYTFWICSDDAGELRISTDASPANAVVRASLSGWANPGNWTKYPSQQSSVITLTAGQEYYIEARQKEVGGEDHVQVAWQGPGMAAKEIIPGRWLVPYLQDYAPWAANQTLVVREFADAGQRVGQITFTEPDLGQAVSNYAITDGNAAGIFAIHPTDGTITVADGGGLVAGTSHILTVSATDDGSPAMIGSASVTIHVLGIHEQLHAWWKLDESSGSMVTDSSGNARNACLTGGGTWITRSAGNQALQLNGVDARFEYGDNNGLSGGTSFSLAAWVKVPVTHAVDGVLIQQQEGGNSGYIGQYRVHVKADGRIHFGVYGKDVNNANEGWQFEITSTDEIKDGVWHHVACVRDGTTGVIFIDGVQAASGSGPIRVLNPALTVAVGRDVRYNNAFLDAAVDDVRMYADALGSQQLVRIASTPAVAITSPVTPTADIPPGVGIMLEAAASDPDGPTPSLAWSYVSGPGSVTFGAPSFAETSAVFSMPGTYVLRATCSDGLNSATDEVTVCAGGTASSPFAGFTYGGGVPGSHTASGANGYNLAGASTGIQAGDTSDGFYLLGRSFSGDFDLRVRVSWMEDLENALSERAGLIVRSGTTGSANEASGFVGFDANPSGSDTYWIRRSSSGAANISTEYLPMTLPSWCRLSRTGDVVEFWHSENGNVWTSRGTMIFSGEVRAGMCWSSSSTSDSGSATFDNLSGFSIGNIAPLVNAGADAPAVVNVPSDLVGSVTDDGLPDPPAATTVSWSVLSGPGSVTFGNSSQAATTITCAEAGEYVFRLVADDGEVKTFDDTTHASALVNSISVAATDDAAAETGPDAGTFTFTRGGSLVGDLTVDFTLTGTAVNGVDHALVPTSILIPDGTTTATLTITPEADSSVEGPESVTLTITPGDYDINGGNATIVIADSNHAPVWNAPTITGDEAEENSTYSGTSLATQATDPDGNTLTFSKTGGPAWLDVAADGSLSGTPATGDIGPNTFGIRVTDAGGLFADAVLDISVHFANLPPTPTVVPFIAANAMARIPYAGQSMAAAATDPNLEQGDVLTFVKTSGPDWLIVAADGALSGTPQNSDIGSGVFGVTVSDIAGASVELVVHVAVTPTTLHLDVNGVTPGSGAPAVVTWDSSAIWSAEPDGVTTTYSWLEGANAVLSAGNDAVISTITVSGSHTLGGLTVEEGEPTLTGGMLVLAEAATVFNITGTLEVESEITGTDTGFVKSGPGILGLSGNHTFTGAGTVSAGDLRLSGSLTASSGVIVETNGTLSGGGSFTCPMNVAGTLAPGDGIGTLTTGPLVLATGAHLQWQAGDWTGAAGSGYDHLIATSLDLPEAASITLVLSAESLTNFTDEPTSFTLVHTTSGISGFDTGKFTIDSTAFPDAIGNWALRQSGDDLVLDYAPLTPFQAWQLAEFGPDAGNPLLAGDDADPDADGRANLLEYALDTDPHVVSTTGIILDMENVADINYLRLTISRNPDATDLTYTVQTTADLTDPGAWTDADTLIEMDSLSLLVVRDTLAGPHRFIRLRVTR